MTLTDRIFIRVYLGDDLVEVFQANTEQIVIGQEGDAHLKLKGEGVSPVHTMIEKRGEQFYICDLGSKEGTIKDNEKVLDTAIHSGEDFHIGPYRLEFYIGLPKPVATKKETPSLPQEKIQEDHQEPSAMASSKKEQKPSRKTHKEENGRVEKKRGEHVSTRASSVPPPMVEESFSFGSLNEISSAPLDYAKTGTYAPPSEIKDLKEYIQPSRGTVVEVTVSWKERILATRRFDKSQIVTIGNSLENSISLPVFSSHDQSHVLLKIQGSRAEAFITSHMNGEVRKGEQTSSFGEMITKGHLRREGIGYAIELDQSSVIIIEISEGIFVYIRYIAPTPKPIAAPFMLFTTKEIATLIVVLMLSGILGIYFAIYTPDAPELQQEDDTVRKAVFVYDRPKQRVEVSEAKKVESNTQPIKDLQVAKNRGEEGKAAPAKPNNSNSQVKKLTTPNPGAGKGIQKAQVNQKAKPDSGAQSQKPDPTKSGIFSAFGSKGFQDQLSKTYSGAGSLGGLAGQATGTGGQAAVGAGDTAGAGLKDIGAGGEGTATYGIAGVKTRGRGGGNTGYGTGNLGAIARATIVPGGEGESFTGGIDKEAIRKAILDNLRLFQACYDRALNKQPDLYGKVIPEWVITDRGRVGNVRIKSTTLNNAEVENCLLARLKTIKFPEPPQDQEALVTYPFLFNAP